MSAAEIVEVMIPTSHDLKTRVLFSICRHGKGIVALELVKEYGEGNFEKSKYIYECIRELQKAGYVEIESREKENKSRGRKKIKICKITSKGVIALIRSTLLNKEHRRQISEILFKKCNEVIDYVQFKFGFDQKKFLEKEAYMDLLDSLLEAIGNMNENELLVRLEQANDRYDFREYKNYESFARHFNEYVTKCVVHLLLAIRSDNSLQDRILAPWRRIIESRGLDFSKNELKIILDNIVDYLHSKMIWRLVRQLPHALHPTLLILGTPVLPLSILIIILYFIHTGSIPFYDCIRVYFIITVFLAISKIQKVLRIRNMLKNVTIR